MPKCQLRRLISIAVVPAFALVSEPCTQANIEQGHDEGEHWRGMVAHVRTRRRAGNRDRRAQSQPVVPYVSHRRLLFGSGVFIRLRISLSKFPRGVILYQAIA